MAKKAPVANEKPTFDPADMYAGAEDLDEQPTGLDFGNDVGDLTGTDDDAPNQFGDLDLDDFGGEPVDKEPEPEAEEEELPEEEEQPEPEAEEEEQPEEQPEPDAEEETPPPAAKDTDKSKKPDIKIPKSRLDRQIAKTRQLEEHMKQLQKELDESRKQAAQKEQVSEEQIQEWLKESAQKATDGHFDDAVALQQKAFKAMQGDKGTSAQVDVPDVETLVAQIEERAELKQVIKRVFTEFPALDPDSETFDEALNEEALEYQDVFLARGYTLPAAVEKAIEVVTTLHGLKAPAEVGEPKAPVRDTKPKIKDKIATSKQQPPQPSGKRGNKVASEDTVDIRDIRDDETYAALPESVKARLRGDTL